jgi:hypothetical protein
MTELRHHLTLRQRGQPQLIASKHAVIDKYPDPMVDELDGPRVEPADGDDPMRHKDGQERGRTDRERLIAGKCSSTHDGPHCDAGGEVDCGPLGQCSSMRDPQTEQRDNIPQCSLGDGGGGSSTSGSSTATRTPPHVDYDDPC